MLKEIGCSLLRDPLFVTPRSLPIHRTCYQCLGQTECNATDFVGTAILEEGLMLQSMFPRILYYCISDYLICCYCTTTGFGTKGYYYVMNQAGFHMCHTTSHGGELLLSHWIYYEPFRARSSVYKD
jgi:hypothetical protein